MSFHYEKTGRWYATIVNWTSTKLHPLIFTRMELLRDLSGVVLEVGAGAGHHLRFIPPGVRYIGVEPNDHLRRDLSQRARERFAETMLVDGVAENIPWKTGTADAVVCMFVLCSVVDQQKAIAEALRVLKPGGTLRFLEHVAAGEGTSARRWQQRLSHLTRRFAGGCELHRDTFGAIKAAGFSEVRLVPSPDRPYRPLAPMVAGIATK